uniref:Uncharacterized protein n=1 Tax=Arundo donax TaxID=35708 RepID=A0A0A8Y349_ARUDO
MYYLIIDMLFLYCRSLLFFLS